MQQKVTKLENQSFLQCIFLGFILYKRNKEQSTTDAYIHTHTL